MRHWYNEAISLMSEIHVCKKQSWLVHEYETILEDIGLIMNLSAFKTKY